jgi:ABC-type sugar transport system ATPase subunit
MDAIRAENLIKRYGETEVLKAVNLQIQQGEFYALRALMDLAKQHSPRS